MRLQKWTALAGFAFVAATLGTVVSESAGPDISQTSARVAAKIASDRTDVLANSVLHLVAGITAVALAALMAALMRERGARPLAAQMVLGFGVVTASASLLSGVLGGTVAGAIGQVSGTQLPYILYRAAEASAAASTIFFAGVILVVALALTQVGLLPRAAAPSGAVVSVIFFAGGFNYLAPDSGALLPFRTLGGVLVLIYLLAVSVALLRPAASGDRRSVTHDAALT